MINTYFCMGSYSFVRIREDEERKSGRKEASFNLLKRGVYITFNNPVSDSQLFKMVKFIKIHHE